MDDQRKLAPIVGKLANIDADISERTILGDGGFKKLVGGDAIQVDPKHVRPYTYIPRAKQILAGNNLPIIRDKTDGTFNKLLYIQFPCKLGINEQNLTYLQDFANDTSGIVGWSVIGAKRLFHNNGRFAVINDSMKAVEGYKGRENPLREFLKDNVVSQPEAILPTQEFTEKFNNGRPPKDQYSVDSVGKALSSMRVEMTPGAVWVPKLKKTARCLLGYRWKTDDDWLAELGDSLPLESEEVTQ